MVVAAVVPAATQSLFVPSRLSRSFNHLSHSRQFPTVSSNLLLTNRRCHHISDNGSALYLIRNPNNCLSSHRHHRLLKPVAAVDSDLPDPTQSVVDCILSSVKFIVLYSYILLMCLFLIEILRVISLLKMRRLSSGIGGRQSLPQLPTFPFCFFSCLKYCLMLVTLQPETNLLF